MDAYMDYTGRHPESLASRISKSVNKCLSYQKGSKYYTVKTRYAQIFGELEREAETNLQC